MQDFTRFYGIQSPPRHVPGLLRSQLLFGGFSNQFGWLFFGFGLIIVWVFTLNADLTGWYVFSGELETAQGTIVSSQETNVSLNETDVFEYHYCFEADGKEFSGTSYQTGGGLKDQHEAVTIEFLKNRPDVSRIQGMRRGVAGVVFGLMPVIFPAVGLGFMTVGFHKGLKGVRLLRIGEHAKGVLISKEATKMEVNDKTVYKLTFEFSAIDGETYQAVAKTHVPRFLEDEEAESILYDPDYPETAVLLDNLPGRPRIDETGQITPAGFKALIVFILPVATLVGHTIYWLK